jgi:isopentenyl diphosphate isomerase/L-lactate dehydrogenase-like FMN-dependent dehydrogenase
MHRIEKAFNIDQLRDAARRRIPRMAFDFFDGGAESEITLRNNRTDLQSIQLVPNVLRDTTARSLRTEVMGYAASMPLVIAPMGMVSLPFPESELALARAATSNGIPFTISTASSVSIERIAKETDGNCWFQLYPLKNRDASNQLVQRARDAGCRVLVITVDMPILGHRERDTKNGLAIPLRPKLRYAYDCLRCPSWTMAVINKGIPNLVNIADGPPATREFLPIRLLRGFRQAKLTMERQVQRWDASVAWDEIKRIRDAWPGKVAVKGVLSAPDALRLAEMGIDAVVVSNHGGRQLDGAISSIAALSKIASVVPASTELLVDGGFTRGVDVLKALALGAKAVMVGRAALYGAAAGGEAGANKALHILRDEMDRSMALLGRNSTEELRSLELRNIAY